MKKILSALVGLGLSAAAQGATAATHIVDLTLDLRDVEIVPQLSGAELLISPNQSFTSTFSVSAGDVISVNLFFLPGQFIRLTSGSGQGSADPAEESILVLFGSSSIAASVAPENRPFAYGGAKTDTTGARYWGATGEVLDDSGGVANPGMSLDLSGGVSNLFGVRVTGNLTDTFVQFNGISIAADVVTDPFHYAPNTGSVVFDTFRFRAGAGDYTITVPTAVPVPATGLLIAGALGAVAGMRRFRR